MWYERYTNFPISHFNFVCSKFNRFPNSGDDYEIEKTDTLGSIEKSSQETIEFPIKFVMKNLNKVPNHINIQDDKLKEQDYYANLGFSTTHKKKKKSRK